MDLPNLEQLLLFLLLRIQLHWNVQRKLKQPWNLVAESKPKQKSYYKKRPRCYNSPTTPFCQENMKLGSLNQMAAPELMQSTPSLMQGQFVAFTEMLIRHVGFIISSIENKVSRFLFEFLLCGTCCTMFPTICFSTSLLRTTITNMSLMVPERYPMDSKLYDCMYYLLFANKY